MEKSHIHCLICGHIKEIEDDCMMKNYICNRCTKSFPDDYIMYRLKCEKIGIFHQSFNVLEARLVFGDNDIDKHPEHIVEFNDENYEIAEYYEEENK